MIYSCSTQEEEQTNNNIQASRFTPKSRGRSDEVLFVMDSSLWNGSTGELFRSICKLPYPVSSTAEVSFTSQYTDIDFFRGSFKRKHNIVIPVLGTDTSPTGRHYLDLLNMPDTIIFRLISRKDTYSKNQQITYVYAKNNAILLTELNSNELLSRMITQSVRKRSHEFLTPKNKHITDTIQSLYDISISLPKKFEIASLDSNFFWLRRNGSKDYTSIFCYWQPYNTSFTDSNIIAWREQICSNRIFGSDSTDYSMIENQVPLQFIEKSIASLYTKEMRGLWKMKNSIMGGPFISYSVLDQEKNIMYYIEGLIFAPNEPKSTYLKEVQAILDSFSTIK